jgi:hypothetical protein
MGVTGRCGAAHCRGTRESPVKYLLAATLLLAGCGTQYRTKNYIIEKGAVALVILDYQEHAKTHGTVNNGGEVAVIFRDASIPALFLTGQDAEDMRGAR